MYNETQVTQQVKDLLKRISHPSVNSVIAQAADYFVNQPKEASQLAAIKARLEEAKEQVEGAVNEKKKKQAQYKVDAVKAELQQFTLQREEERLARHDNLVHIAREVLALCEGSDFDETVRKSSKILGTIHLLGPAEGRKVAENNDRSKQLYKAVLCLRLFDQLYMDGLIKDAFVLKHLGNITPAQYKYFINENDERYQNFAEQVKIPLIMVAILQDIGNHHPNAKRILYGETSTANPYRILEQAERKQLLQTNYTETMKYLVAGIGEGKYIGGSKEERRLFTRIEKQKVTFMQSILKRWAKPQDIMGNLLKVPQIYISIILSTKLNFDYRLLPKVYQILELNVERGHCNQKIVNCLYKITGMFPMGYGITYIPKDSTGQSLERYEYAIVTRLYPDDPEEPHCRVATRSLTFISRGQDIIVKKDENLYFPKTAKQLSTMSKERLLEILELLASNYQERKHLDVIPRCWHAREFFSIGKNQNLWNKANEI
jgi:hypothetical protein